MLAPPLLLPRASCQGLFLALGVALDILASPDAPIKVVEQPRVSERSGIVSERSGIVSEDAWP